MYNNIDTQADLRTLYQAYSSQIEYSKNQLWTVVYYGILAIGGIVALSKGFITVMNGFETWMIIFPPMIIIILFTCLYNMLKCWRSIVEGRAKFVEIRDMLSLTFRQMLMTRPGSGHSDNYTHWTYDAWIGLPIMFVIACGSIFAYVLQISIMGFCFEQFLQNGLLLIPSIICLVFCLIAFALYYLRHHFIAIDNEIVRIRKKLFSGSTTSPM